MQQYGQPAAHPPAAPHVAALQPAGRRSVAAAESSVPVLAPAAAAPAAAAFLAACLPAATPTLWWCSGCAFAAHSQALAVAGRCPATHSPPRPQHLSSGAPLLPVGCKNLVAAAILSVPPPAGWSQQRPLIGPLVDPLVGPVLLLCPGLPVCQAAGAHLVPQAPHSVLPAAGS